uniref:Variant surface glycoprotein n=1 Tax=Trypanosoma brucei TaxID=5691 RepID=A0A1V0FYI5_9TRYP|nr:variant surface glycoprotein [Trypanosoma brucei]
MYAKDDRTQGCATVEQPETKTASDNDKVAYAICEFLVAAPPEPTDPDNWNPETLTQQAEWSTLYTSYLIATGKYTKEGAIQKAEDIKTALKKLLGMNKDGHKTRCVAPLTESNVKYQDGTTEVEKSLLKIVEDGAAPKIFVYWQGEAAAKEEKTVASSTSCSSKPETTKNAPSKEDCKEHTEQDICKNAGCKFDGSKAPKFFPDTEEKTLKKDEGDGKTTNTTGSNSFVINKAAFLLL